MHQASRESSDAGSHLRILLVEDNPADERLLRVLLSEDGGRSFHFTISRKLSDAVLLVQAAAHDVVLLDLHLPDSSGLANVKELALAAPRTPIVVLTGFEDDALAIQACANGAQDYLIKGRNNGTDLSRAMRCAIARKAFENVLAQQAYFDSLTGLANRGLFNDRLTHALARAERAGKYVAVMFIDLDDFKKVNDGYGHKAGDEVLRAVAEALRGAVRQTDTVARMGGDEFTVIVEPLEDMRSAQIVAKKTLNALQAPINLQGVTVHVTASMGVALFPEHARTADGLLQASDATMFFVKRIGGNGYRFWRALPSVAASLFPRSEAVAGDGQPR